tara:strand:- start:2650 stop:3018 length:369 start_codon:yes stop_codon:yes gene_type:complete
MKNLFLVTLLSFCFISSLIAKDNSELESKIFKNLRCLVCQGQSVADSNSEFSQTIKLVVRDQISQGFKEKEIYEFMADKYGDWIVYKPKFNISNFAVWFLPYFILALGAIIIINLVRKKKIN